MCDRRFVLNIFESSHICEGGDGGGVVIVIILYEYMNPNFTLI